MRISDWSSDVCSSDLVAAERAGERAREYADGAGSAVRGLFRHGQRIRDRFSDRGNDYRRQLTRVAGDFADEANYRYRRARRQVKRHPVATVAIVAGTIGRSEEHTSELQSLMRISYAGFCLKKKQKKNNTRNS